MLARTRLTTTLALLLGLWLPSGNTNATDDAPVFVLTSAQTLAASPLRDIPVQRVQDSIGTPLVLVEVTAEQQHQLIDHVHQEESRCGGYFAFDSRAAAEAFLVNESALVATIGPAGAAYVIDNSATVTPWLAQVNESTIRATIAHLSSYQNRYYRSTHGYDAAVWIRDTWLALGQGRSDVSVELFTDCTNCSTQPSVILTVQGNELANEVVVIGAHLDSIRSGAGTNPEQFAPGADDDASGIATLTEVLRIAMAHDWHPQRTVKFMGYAAEEVGLRGSAAIAQRYASDSVNVVGVLQLDMTNYHVGVPYNLHLISDYSNGPLRTFSQSLFDYYLAPLGLARRDLSCGYACSDHASWTSKGFPAVMASEPGDATYDFFPYLHTQYDTLAQVGGTAEPSTVFARFGLAFIGELAKTSANGSGIFYDGFEAEVPNRSPSP